jgi:hypothetical protein
MTFGAIRVCQFVEVYSRKKQGNWHYTNLDVENRPDNEDPGLEPIRQENVPKEFADLVGDVGTLVIWKKIDRIDTDFDIENHKHWLGRVYRKFIGEKIIQNGKVVKNASPVNITIDIDGQNDKLVAFDPLYVIPNPQRQNDETAALEDDQTYEYSVHEVDSPPNMEKVGKITIRTSLLPASWRKLRKQSGRSKDNNARWVYENEGVSILRAGREVFYDKIPNFSPALEEKDRFWSCEIDFDPVLDYQFSVKNIKVGAKPLAELRERLQEILGPVIKNRFRKAIMDYYDKVEIEESQEPFGSVNSHKTIEEKTRDISKPVEVTTSKQEQEKAAKEFVDEKNLPMEEQKELLKKLLDPNAPPFIVQEDIYARSDGPFIDIVPGLAKKTVVYNMNHPFFRSVYDKIKKLQEVGKTADTSNIGLLSIANDFKLDIDQLIFALADTIYDTEFGPKSKTNGQEVFEDFIYDLSRMLRKSYRQQGT